MDKKLFGLFTPINFLLAVHHMIKFCLCYSQLHLKHQRTKRRLMDAEEPTIRRSKLRKDKKFALYKN